MRLTLLVTLFYLHESLGVSTKNECNTNLRDKNKSICVTPDKDSQEIKVTVKVGEEAAKVNGTVKTKRSLAPLTNEEIDRLKEDLQRLMATSSIKIGPLEYKNQGGIVLLSHKRPNSKSISNVTPGYGRPTYKGRRITKSRPGRVTGRLPGRVSGKVQKLKTTPPGLNQVKLRGDNAKQEIEIRKLASLPKDAAYLSYPFILVNE